MGLAGAARPSGHEPGELLAGRRPAPGIINPGVVPALGGRGGPALAGLDLLVLALAQQGGDLLGLEQAGQTQVLLLLNAAHHSAGAELTAIEKHTIELGSGIHRLEGAEKIVAGPLLLIGLSDESILGAGEQAIPLRAGPAQNMVASELHLVGHLQQRGHRGQENAGGLTPGA